MKTHYFKNLLTLLLILSISCSTEEDATIVLPGPRLPGSPGSESGKIVPPREIIGFTYKQVSLRDLQSATNTAVSQVSANRQSFSYTLNGTGYGTLRPVALGAVFIFEKLRIDTAFQGYSNKIKFRIAE